MSTRLVAFAFMLPCALLAACATQGTMDARYEASLARWKGTPESQLRQTWGKPVASEEMPDGRMLIYVVRHDFDNRANPQTYRIATVSAFGAPVMTSGMTVAPTVPVTCTTSFVLRHGVVESWRFEGIGCGAPE